MPPSGYYPDPSVPGFVRYWDGHVWVPGTSRPAPGPGQRLEPPPRRARGETEGGQSGLMYLDHLCTDPVEDSVAGLSTVDAEPRPEFRPESRAEPPAEPEAQPDAAAPSAAVPVAWGADAHGTGARESHPSVPRQISWGAPDADPGVFGPAPDPGVFGPPPELDARATDAAPDAPAEYERAPDSEESLPEPQPESQSAPQSEPPPAQSWTERVHALAVRDESADAAIEPHAAAGPAAPSCSAPPPKAAARSQQVSRRQPTPVAERLTDGNSAELARYPEPLPARPLARPAPMPRRVLARLVDSLVMTVLLACVAVPTGQETLRHLDDKVDQARHFGGTVTIWLLDSTVLTNVGLLLLVLAVLGCCWDVLPTAFFGATLGKRLLRVRVVDRGSHRPPGLARSARRWAVRTVLALLLVGVPLALWRMWRSPLGQCAHDTSADTFVAEVRARRR